MATEVFTKYVMLKSTTQVDAEYLTLFCLAPEATTSPKGQMEHAMLSVAFREYVDTYQAEFLRELSKLTTRLWFDSATGESDPPGAENLKAVMVRMIVSVEEQADKLPIPSIESICLELLGCGMIRRG
jgi:hypothetical protein